MHTISVLTPRRYLSILLIGYALFSQRYLLTLRHLNNLRIMPVSPQEVDLLGTLKLETYSSNNNMLGRQLLDRLAARRQKEDPRKTEQRQRTEERGRVALQDAAAEY